jgi:hypothetical protein
LMDYLPLWKHNNVLYGLTAYCAPGGAITGLESHFRSGETRTSSSIGHKTGSVIFFGLADSEYLDYAEIICDEIGFLLVPFLMVRTAHFLRMPLIHPTALYQQGQSSMLSAIRIHYLYS